MRYGALTYSTWNEILSGDKACENGISIHYFGGCLRQGFMFLHQHLKVLDNNSIFKELITGEY
jgi:hypothetical protein